MNNDLKQPKAESSEPNSFKNTTEISKKATSTNEEGQNDWEIHFDNLDSGFVNGWAWIRSLPNTPVKVEVSLSRDKHKIGIADVFRKDLLDAGMGNGVHGFRIDVRDWDLSGAAITLSPPGKRGEANAITIPTNAFSTLLRQDWFPKFLGVLEPALAEHSTAHADLLS